MWLLQLLQECGVEITSQIKALIDKFGNRYISKQFRTKFIERIDGLLNPFVFGVKPPISLRTSLDKIFSYTSEDFAKDFPKFEVLFLNIWCLIRASLYDWRNPIYNDLNTMIDDDGNIICYYYCRQTSDDTVTIKFKGDSATVDIEHKSDNDPFIVITITPTEKKNETEKCKTILSGDVNAPSVRACFHLTAFYSG